MMQVERQEEEVAQSSSVQLTKSLQEISRLRKVLHEVGTMYLLVYKEVISPQVELQLHRNLLDQESQYLIHMDVFGETGELCTYNTASIQKNKNVSTEMVEA